MYADELKKKVRSAIQTALLDVFGSNADSAMTYVEGIKLEDALCALLAPMVEGDPAESNDHAIEVIEKIRALIEDPLSNVGETLLDIVEHLNAFEVRFRRTPEVPE